MYYSFIFAYIIFFLWNFKKKEFSIKKLNQNPYTIRVIGSNISLDRFFDNNQTEIIIKELISISSPEKERNILFVWPEGIIPNTYKDELHLYSDIFKRF